MIVKNEEKNLDKCLSSVKDCVDEIIIVDTGSTDNTPEVAKKYKSDFYEYEWKNDFSSARNFGLEKATKDLILYLDADEILTDESVKIINSLKNRSNQKAFYCTIINENHYTNRPSVMSYPRIFPNKKNIRFEGKVHEQIIPSLLKNNIPIESSEVKIIHSGYDLNTEELRNKAKRNLEILLKEYKEKPDSYVAYQIGQTYNIIQNYTEAEKYFLFCLQKKGLEIDYKATALRVLSDYALNKLDIRKSYELISEAIKLKPNSIINYLQRAKLLSILKNEENCFKDIETARNFCNENNKDSTINFQEIMIPLREVIEEGLRHALNFKNEKYFELYCNLYESNSWNREFINLVKMIKRGEKIIDFEELNNLSEKQVEILQLTLLNSEKFYESVYDELEKIFPDNYSIKKDYGLRLFRVQNYNKAESKFQQAEKINDEDLSLKLFLLSVYLANGNTDEAKMKLDEIENLNALNDELKNQIRAIRKKLTQN